MPGQHGTSAIAFALALVVASASSLAAAGSLDEQCHKMLRRQVFNCACTTDFLDAQLEAEQAEIMRELWILAVNEAGQSEAVAARYRVCSQGDRRCRHGVPRASRPVAHLLHQWRPKHRRLTLLGRERARKSRGWTRWDAEQEARGGDPAFFTAQATRSNAAVTRR